MKSNNFIMKEISYITKEIKVFENMPGNLILYFSGKNNSLW